MLVFTEYNLRILNDDISSNMIMASPVVQVAPERVVLVLVPVWLMVVWVVAVAPVLARSGPVPLPLLVSPGVVRHAARVRVHLQLLRPRPPQLQLLSVPAP